MRKDITIAKVVGVHLAIVQEYNPEFEFNDWNAYIINENLEPIEMVLVVSKGGNATKVTSTMRHSLKNLPAKSYAKVELLHQDVLALTNTFSVTYFIGNTMYEKDFVFAPNTVNDTTITTLPLVPFKGVLGK